MNISVWLPPVLAAVIGALLSPSVGKGLLILAGARARRIKHVPVDGAELYSNGMPMDESQFRAAFAAYQAELDALPPPAERNEWQMKQQFAASQRLAVITGTHPHAFPQLADQDQAWEWYRDNGPYATAALPRRHGFRLLPPGDIAKELPCLPASQARSDRC
jgi:soluble lytic murein transglycosylase-like protein